MINSSIEVLNYRKVAFCTNLDNNNSLKKLFKSFSSDYDFSILNLLVCVKIKLNIVRLKMSV